MASYPEAIEQLIRQLTILPGVGRKTAERYVFALLRAETGMIEQLASSITALTTVRPCTLCYNYTTAERCAICQDNQRDHRIICVVADNPALYAFEQTGDYQGVYHVLGGTINPLEKMGPEQLRFNTLVERVKAGKVKEVIIGMNPDHPGETTALMIIELLQPLGVQLTRLARGLPVGSDIEFADDVTLGEALKERRVIKQ